METGMDKECGALGGLFQAVINDMKGSYPIWEDFNAKAAKLHSQLRTTVLAAAAFLDAFQKVADMATNTRGATRDIGSALTRMCMRHRSIEAKLRHFTNALMESLINPLQERIEDWKKSANQLDKDHAKEYKRARHEIKKKSSDTLKLQKKARKELLGKGDLRPQVENAVQDVNDMYLLLEETEKQAVRKALIEERGRFCTFITFLQPVVDGEIAMLGEITHLQAIVDDLVVQTAEPHKLPPASEQVIKDLKGSDYSWSYQTPPSSPSSSGSRKSSMCSVNSTNSSTSRSSGSQTHSPSSNYRYRSLAQPASSSNRLSSVSSHDSGFISQDAMYSKPPSPMPSDITSQKSSSSASSEASETCQSVSECSSPTSVSSSSTAGAWSGGEKVNHPYPSLILSHPGLRNQQVNAVQHIRVNPQSMCLGPISTPLCDTFMPGYVYYHLPSECTSPVLFGSTPTIPDTGAYTRPSPAVFPDNPPSNHSLGGGTARSSTIPSWKDWSKPGPYDQPVVNTLQRRKEAAERYREVEAVSATMVYPGISVEDGQRSRVTAASLAAKHGEEISTAASDLAMVLTRGLSLEHQKSSRDSLQYSSGYSTQTTTPSCSEDTIPSQGTSVRRSLCAPFPVSDYDCYSVNGDAEGDHQSEFDRSSTIPRNSDITQSYRRMFQTKRPASTAGLPTGSAQSASVTPGVATIRRTPSTKPSVRRALSSAGPIPIRPPIVPVKTPTVPDGQVPVRVGSEESVFFSDDTSPNALDLAKASPKRLSLPNTAWGGGGTVEISVYPGGHLSSEEQQQLAANRHSLVEKIGELVASAQALGEGQFPFPSVLPASDEDLGLPPPPLSPSESPEDMLTAIRRGVKLRRTVTNDRSAPRIL
ncbi:protein MTSS 2 isoform X2 [Amblyraja radiata]|uniref:protein MTSS 2 isoform X2 n=1 Tax=Amblyraja radiata TaxID=386614 RepID=UPI0014033509|nr:protein MTSS 2 isoform X2 [Amblyraja radiata]